MIKYQSLPYAQDPTEVFARLCQLPWAMWLDSGQPGVGAERYDIMVASPRLTLVGRGGAMQLSDGATSRLCSDDPFRVIREYLPPLPPDVHGLPFRGGAVGYFGYDLGERLLGLAPRPGAAFPELAVGIYDWAVVVDHQLRRTVYAGAAEPLERVLALLDGPLPAPAGFELRGAPRQQPELAAYHAAFDRVQRYLRDGDCYQVNLARRYSVPAAGDAWPAYLRLRALSPAPLGAFLDFPFGQVLSVSPERFLHLQQGRVRTEPIKGTRPRRDAPEDDARERSALMASAKDRAENIMIVDLLRNDLGKVCRPGTVRVAELCALRSYASVHHLVSTVSGELAAGADGLELLRACLPGGSITGAPKRRAMEIIAELEPRPREVYCGAIGYIGGDGRMDTSIAIRTACFSGQELSYWAGGGLVADSEPEAEFRETEHKAAGFLRLLAELSRA